MRSSIRDIGLGGPEHVPRDDDETFIRTNPHADGEPVRVEFGRIAADDGDVAVVELPDLRAILGSPAVTEFSRGLAQPPFETGVAIHFPRTHHDTASTGDLCLQSDGFIEP